MKTGGGKFIFRGYRADLRRRRIHFFFGLETKRRTFRFTETITLPRLKPHLVPSRLLTNILNNLSLILGISYWKIACPQTIEIAPFRLSKTQAEFWNTIYTKGLGELFYKNKIDFRGLVQFPYDVKMRSQPIPIRTKNRSLLLLGGGKDSLVAAEMYKMAKKPFTLLVVNEHEIHNGLLPLIGASALAIRRELDPLLFKLGQEKGFYNGHIPVSAIYAFLGVLAAALYDYRYVVAANEKSANEGNVIYLGESINHQWSKSAEFEKLFQAYTQKHITHGITYFSPLRPYTELEITKMFTRHKKYFPVFSSCNKNFRIGARRLHHRRWCGTCLKCAFIFAALAAFLPKKEVIAIFGKNLFGDATLTPLYQQLLGWKGIKPFECVGTPDEMRRVFVLIKQRGEFEHDPVSRMFVERRSRTS